MIRGLRDFRLLPLVLLAVAALFTLKSLGLVVDGGYLFGPTMQEAVAPVAEPPESDDIVGSIGAPAKPKPAVPEVPAVAAPVIPAGAAVASRPSWAQEMFNYPDITGSVGGGKKEAPPAAAPGHKPAPAGPPPNTQRPPTVPEQRTISPSERAILERLQERRKDLDTRARELEMREALLKATELRLEGKVQEVKQAEERMKVSGDRKENDTAARFKGLIAMYENMKAKDAARIFDRLDLKVLVDVASHINPRRMSDILANMSSEAAERLTVEFASRNGLPKAPAVADLPKIEGKPSPAAPPAPGPAPEAKR